MKKILGLVASAILMAGALVGFATAPASAACPYGGCIPTNTFIDAPDEVERGDRAKICIRVGSNGNGRPKGNVRISVVRDKGEFKFVDSRKYNDRQECFKTPKLKRRGSYVIKAVFDKKPGSKWKDSDNNTSMRVTKRG